MEPDRAADRAPAGDRRRLCPPVRHLQAALRPHPGSHGRDLRRGRRPRYPRCPTEEDEGDMTMNFKKMAAGLALGAAVAAVPVLAPHAQEAKHTIVTVVKRSEEHTSELQSLMRISYAVFCLKKKNTQSQYTIRN